MRVLHVIPAVASRYGGPVTVISHMVSALNRLAEVHAEIAMTVAEALRTGLTVRICRRTCPCTCFGEHGLSSGNYVLVLRQWVGQHTGDYDILHIHSVWSFATGAAGRIEVDTC